MAESTSLLANVDESTPRIGSSDDKRTAASDHFKHLIKVLTIITLILSTLAIALLIANNVIVRNAPVGYTWNTPGASRTLMKVMVASLVFSVVNTFVNFPILLNMIVDVVLAAFTIAKVVRLIEAFPNSAWCQTRYRYPNRDPIYPHPKCGHWKLVVTILMGIVAGFSIIIAAIYLVQLMLRSIAIYRTKLWKRPLSWTLPTGEVTFQVSLKVLRQEGAGQSVESGAGAAHGPVYL